MARSPSSTSDYPQDFATASLMRRAHAARGARGCVPAPGRTRLATISAPSTPSQERSVMNNAKLAAWVNEMAAMCQPEKVVWCDGSSREYQEMLRVMVQSGSAQWLDSQK